MNDPIFDAEIDKLMHRPEIPKPWLVEHDTGTILRTATENECQQAKATESKGFFGLIVASHNGREFSCYIDA